MNRVCLALVFSSIALRAQIGTPVGTSGVGDSSTTSIASGAHTTTTGDLLAVFEGHATACNIMTASAAFNGAISSVIADTAGDTWHSYVPSGGAYLVGIQLVSGGTYTHGSVTDDPAWIAESAMGTQTMAAANRMWSQSAQLAGAMTNCVAGGTIYFKLALTGTASSAVQVSKATVTTPRLLTVQAN